MKIKRKTLGGSWIVRTIRVLWHRRLLRLVVLGAMWLFGIAIGVYLQSSGRLPGLVHAVRDKVDMLRSRNVELVTNMGSGFLATPERLVIHIKFEHYEALRRQREEALATQVLTLTSEDYVPASLEHDGNSIPIRMRLKGDLTDHLEQGDKWSFRIRVRGDNTFVGMKQFSLHHPNARNYVYEWLFHRALAREDVLGLRYDFVKVTLNGRDLGVYALEEHFEKRLVEHNLRREGPIVRFSEDRLWEEWRQQKIPFPGARQSGGGSYLASEIDAFQTQRWSSNPSDQAIHDKAVDLLESFRNGTLTTSDVFDVPTLSRFLALTDLMGAEHGARWHNTRFYYNPVTSRLEPIGFDGDSGKAISELVYHMKDRHWSRNAWSSDPQYFKALFEDPELVTAYFAALERISQASYLQEFLDSVGDELKSKLRIIHSEDPAFRFDPSILFQNQRYIRSVLNPSVALAAYRLQENAGRVHLRLGNVQALPVEVTGVSVGQQACKMSAAPVALAGRTPTDLVTYADVDIEMPDAVTPDETALVSLTVEYCVGGLARKHTAPVVAWPFASLENQVTDVMRQKSTVEQFEFVHVDESKRSITLARGDWSVTTDLVVPSGYTFRCGPGTRLHMTESAVIVSRSPLEFVGDASEPIVIDSPDGTGQGLLVVDAGGQSRLDHVVFRGLAFPQRPGWVLTGAVTFYGSPVRFADCQFLDNRSEDGLNVIRSQFSLVRCVFADTPSDAFDSDFCVGEIHSSVFQRPGNDGIDVSGSTVELHDIRIIHAGDKGVSVGENSRVDATDVSVDRSRLGVAIKDLSHLDARKFVISDTQIGCAAYRKKPEFGPSTATFVSLTMRSVETPYMIERGSRIEVDGVRIDGTRGQVARTLEAAVPATERSQVPSTQNVGS